MSDVRITWVRLRNPRYMGDDGRVQPPWIVPKISAWDEDGTRIPVHGTMWAGESFLFCLLISFLTNPSTHKATTTSTLWNMELCVSAGVFEREREREMSNKGRPALCSREPSTVLIIYNPLKEMDAGEGEGDDKPKKRKIRTFNCRLCCSC